MKRLLALSLLLCSCSALEQLLALAAKGAPAPSSMPSVTPSAAPYLPPPSASVPVGAASVSP